MDIVIDTSALLAVVLREPERDRIVELTVEHTLIGPDAIPWEDGTNFAIIPQESKVSPLDVSSVRARISTKELVDLVRNERGRAIGWKAAR